MGEKFEVEIFGDKAVISVPVASVHRVVSVLLGDAPDGGKQDPAPSLQEHIDNLLSITTHWSFSNNAPMIVGDMHINHVINALAQKFKGAGRYNDSGSAVALLDVSGEFRALILAAAKYIIDEEWGWDE